MHILLLLQQDHQLILLAAQLLEQYCQMIEKGFAPDRSALESLLNFFTEFADLHHHIKEEEILFPYVLSHHPEISGPIHCMQQEHNQGRKLIADMRTYLDHHQQFLIPAKTYATLIQEHIAKENYVLFPMINRFVEDTQLVKLGCVALQQKNG